MDIPMRDGNVPEDAEEEELADETSTPGSSTLEVEKPLSDVEDYLMENHNDGTGKDDNSMAASSSGMTGGWHAGRARPTRLAASSASQRRS